MMRVGVTLALGASLLIPTTSAAQVEASGYLLAVGSASGSSFLAASGQTGLTRGRIMLAAAAGDFSFDVAYEHVASRTSNGTGFQVTGTGSTTPDWLGADWRIWEGTRGTPPVQVGEWRHRFDRIQLQWASEMIEVTIGRQAISWGTTLFLTPADPFQPFSPSDPFRVYRGGVDAIRVRAFPGPFTEIEVVARATDTMIPIVGATRTLLVRAQTSVGGWAVGGWAGELHEAAAVAAFATGSLGSTAIRGEASLRRSPRGGNTVRGTLGLDRYFMIDGKDASILAEVQYDGFGVAGEPYTPSLPLWILTPIFRGELQTLGRWTGVGQSSLQVHPLVGLDAIVIMNLGDRSAMVGPGINWSASQSATVRLGGYAGLGSAPTPARVIGSEYGAVPNVAYASLTWFF